MGASTPGAEGTRALAPSSGGGGGRGTAIRWWPHMGSGPAGLPPGCLHCHDTLHYCRQLSMNRSFWSFLFVVVHSMCRETHACKPTRARVHARLCTPAHPSTHAHPCTHAYARTHARTHPRAHARTRGGTHACLLKAEGGPVPNSIKRKMSGRRANRVRCTRIAPNKVAYSPLAQAR